MNKKYVLIGVGVVALILLYLWYKKTHPSLTDALNNVPVDVTTNPGTGQVTVNAMAANGTVTVPSAVTNWANTLPPNNKAQFFKMLPTMTAADIAGLNDLVLNEWAKGALPTAAQSQFWNGWRTKYHVSDGTINN